MRILLIIVFSIWFIACSDTDRKATANANTSEQDSAQFTTIQWIEPSKNLGKIAEGQVLQIHFRFKNTGDKPLIIKNVRPSCGCTVADFPKEPIAPGQEGEITGSFDSKGRSDLQSKEIFVEANTKGSVNHTLHFELDVVKSAGAKN
ncbi:MAG TPA: DUF1573 domain-containing protein [Flavitalea sp.]|nr:DUF1573 domain-containing protein [Flavitalea sp.]